jgi:hypothetical protein
MKQSVRHFIEDEKKGIKDYRDSMSDKKYKRAYEKILPQEKKHLKLLKSSKHKALESLKK